MIEIFWWPLGFSFSFKIFFLGHGDPDVECNKCHKVYATKFSLRAHRKIHNRKFPCKYCTRSFSRLEGMQTHMTKMHFLFTCDLCDYMAAEFADLQAHRQTHESVYKDSSDTELDHSIFDDVTSESDIIHFSDHDWKSESVDNFTPENVDQDSHDNVVDFQDDERDFILQDPRDICVPIQTPEGNQFNKNIEVPRDAKGKIIQKKTNQGRENGDSDSVIAKVMSNKAFLAKKTARNRRYSKVCNSNKNR